MASVTSRSISGEVLPYFLLSSGLFAIIEADNLVDGVLKKLGYSGETMGERIQFIDRHEVPSLENLWQAHRLRNKLVHEPDYNLRREEMERAVRNYETTLKELGAI